MKKIIAVFILSAAINSLMAQTITPLPFKNWVPTLPSATDLTGAYIPVVQGGNAKKAVVSLFMSDGKAHVATGTDTYLLSIPSLPAVTLGLEIGVIFTNGNTSTSSININGSGAIPIKKNVSVSLTAGDISNGSAWILIYDGTNFQLTGGTGSGSSGLKYGTTTGAGTYVSTISGVSAYIKGDSYVIKFSAGNAGASTLNINSLGAKSIISNGSSLTGNEISAGQTYLLTYDSTNFIIANPPQANATVPGIVNLYNTTGSSTTGTMDQNSITNAISSISPGSNLYTDAEAGAIISSVYSLTKLLAVKVMTTTALPSNSYSSGVITASSTGTLPSIDGVVLNSGDYLIVNNESFLSHNGIYIVTNTGGIFSAFVLTRRSDADTPSELTNSFAYVQSGSVNKEKFYYQTIYISIVGVTDIKYSQIVAPPLRIASEQSSNYGSNLLGEFVPFDLTSNTWSFTLPNAPPEGTMAGAKIVKISGSNTLIVSANGTDVFDFVGGPGTKILSALNQSQIYKYNASSGVWYVLSGDASVSAGKWTTARNLAGNSVDGSANVAFANKFIVQGTTDSGLSGAQFLGALTTGILKNTTTTGVLSIAIAGDFPTLNQNTTGTASAWTTGRTISITGDLAYTSPSIDGSGNVTAAGTLATVNGNVGTFGSATKSIVATVNGKGLGTAFSEVTITPAVGSITGLGTGVGTWLATPSWTNFTSAITGTAPFWNTGGATTLISSNSINSTIANSLTFSSTGTTNANNQIANTETGTHTMRGTAADNFTVNQIASNVTLGSTTQNPIGLDVEMTYVQTGGVSTTVVSTTTVAGMTATTYTSVAPASTSGSGTGALFTVVVGSATSITSITQTTAGSGYKVNETITFNGSQFGSGSGSAIFTIRSVSGVSLGTSATTLRVGVSGSNLNDTPKLIDLLYQGSSIGAIGVYSLSNAVAFTDNTGVAAITYSPTAVRLVTATTALSTLNVNGAATFLSTISQSVAAPNNSNAFTQSGSNASAATSSIFNTTGSVGGMFIANVFSSKYKSTASVVTNGVGVINTISITTPGTGYSTSTQSTTGGTGTGAVINVTATAGAITGATLSTRGSGYTTGDILTVSGGTGGTLTITAVDFAGTISVFDDANTITDGKSNNKYVSLLARPTYNITSTQVGSVYGFRYVGTHTALGSFNQYNLVYENTGSVGGIGNAAPLSSWDINGSIGNNITLSTGNLTLDATHSTIIITSGTGTYTIPAASGATRRIYRIVNQTGGARTTSTYLDKSNASQTTVGANSVIYIQSDGSNWYQIN